MAENTEPTDLNELAALTQSTTVRYKDKNGAVKTLVVVQPMDPEQRRFTFSDLQILARQISNQLKLDAE